jgi:hypothetical protein
MQAIAKTVRIGQTQCVKIVTPYITCTVDDILRQMHNEKVNVVNSITGDLNIDDMYNNMMHINDLIMVLVKEKVVLGLGKVVPVKEKVVSVKDKVVPAKEKAVLVKGKVVP